MSGSHPSELHLLTRFSTSSGSTSFRDDAKKVSFKDDLATHISAAKDPIESPTSQLSGIFGLSGALESLPIAALGDIIPGEE